MDIEVSLIDPPRIPLRPVRTGDLAFIQLKDSMRAGFQIQPILVRPKLDRFEVVVGNHRYTAAKMLGWATLDCKVREVDDREALYLAIEENAQRIETKPSEYATQIKRLITDGTTLEDMAAMLSKSTVWVRHVMSLDSLLDKIKPEVDSGKIPLMSGYALSRIRPMALQAKFLKMARKMPAHRFRGVVDNYIMQAREAASQGKLIDRFERYQPRAFLSPLKAVLEEIKNQKAAARIITARNITTLRGAWVAALEHIANIDPEGTAKQREEAEKFFKPKKLPKRRPTDNQQN